MNFWNQEIRENINWLQVDHQWHYWRIISVYTPQTFTITQTPKKELQKWVVIFKKSHYCRSTFKSVLEKKTSMKTDLKTSIPQRRWIDSQVLKIDSFVTCYASDMVDVYKINADNFEKLLVSQKQVIKSSIYKWRKQVFHNGGEVIAGC